MDCQKNDKVEISQSFNVENSKNKSSIFFVKVADEEIGAINVTEYEGKKLTSFLYSENFFNDIGEERISAVSYTHLCITGSAKANYFSIR